MNHINIHLLMLIGIMLCSGAFGGYLNYLHNFDTVANENKDKRVKLKYVLLGIGSAFLVPAFLKMIASDLIKDTEQYDNISYLIFAGFCLIAAIFSRRFINTIGERILEAAKQAQQTSKETKQQVESTQQELTNTQERIEDVKLAVSLKTFTKEAMPLDTESSHAMLLELVDSFIERTSVPDYAERLKLKAEIGRKMGQIIISHNLPQDELLTKYPKEGMYLGLAYSVELRPNPSCLSLLNKLAKITSQLYTKYVILLAYKTLASSGLISKEAAKEVAQNVRLFRAKADKPLLRNINDTISVLKFINPEIGSS
ncbi:hypothetical protein I2I11_13785 [Pontibacter sp. 172403-2]|uniref:YEATS-associated helix-containing protein n=1 Tax=Pontibacter rufus TaxID=2791028 RepID=UPI0018AFEF40|nr:YEATS-associated helix-containing protein [Pontibacter sp. 172403-2]MBF9254372.1 hypothetical protein [Pontibacter sp. 172403-2]